MLPLLFFKNSLLLEKLRSYKVSTHKLLYLDERLSKCHYTNTLYKFVSLYTANSFKTEQSFSVSK